MNKILLLLIVIFITSFTFAKSLNLATKNQEPLKVMQLLESEEQILEKWASKKIKKNTSLFNKKKKIVNKIMDKLLDYNFIASYVLGKKWTTISEAKKKDFIIKLKKLLNKFYLENAVYSSSYEKKYLEKGNETLYLKGIPKSIYITTEIKIKVHKKPVSYELIYHFRKINKQYKIFDLELDSVSWIRDYKEQFKKFLKNKTIDNLIKKIDSKLKKKK